MKPSVYIEITIPSYLTAWRSPDLVMAANQETTKDWWEIRDEYELYVSLLVIQEASAGDPSAAERRLKHIKDITIINITEEAESLAGILLQKVPLPVKAKIDALHIAVATLNGMDYLLTWNCSHIANAIFRPKVENICREFGYEPPTICTPQELKRTR